MNRTLNLNATPCRRSARPSFGDWMMLFAACLRCFFARREARIGMRMFFGGSAFMLMLGVVGGIECGNVALLPGGFICLALMGVAFLLLRGLGEEF